MDKNQYVKNTLNLNTLKTVLLSTASLPHTGVASWTTRMNYFLEKENSLDYIIGPYSTIKIDKPKQIFTKPLTFTDKIKRKFNRINRFNNYIRGLQEVLKQEQQIILQVKDNIGLLKAVVRFIEKNCLRKRVYIQFHHHTFQFDKLDENLLNKIDEIVFLTQSSYQYNKQHLNAIPCLVSINNNGVDSTVFHPITSEEKKELKQQLKLNNNNLIFVWCSQNRRKKGLEVVLNAWEEVYKKNKNIQLIVIGIPKEINVYGVISIGLIDNKKLAEYYKVADFYLFSTLCQEGFGLSLIEALKSGCYCIASNYGAVPELLKKGKYGTLISNPNNIDNWIVEIEKAVTVYQYEGENPYAKQIPVNLYDIANWHKRYNTIINNAKKAFKHRYYIE